MHRRITTLLACIVCHVLCMAAIARADDFKNFHPNGYVTDRAGNPSIADKNPARSALQGAGGKDRRADGHRDR